jgi:hypothetical protein
MDDPDTKPGTERSQPIVFGVFATGMKYVRCLRAAIEIDQLPGIMRDSQQVLAVFGARRGDQLLDVFFRAAAATVDHMQDSRKLQGRRIDP